MSYLNISYSTLEDAWGGGFDKHKKHRLEKNSEVCNLYNQRHNATYRPYKTVMESDYIKPMYVEDNYVKYHGYKDGRPYGRPRHRLAKYKVTLPTFTKGTHRYLTDDEEDENDRYLLEEENVDDEDKVYGEDTDDDDDVYMNNELYANERGRSNYISPIIDPKYAKKATHSIQKKSNRTAPVHKPYREIDDVSDGYKETPFSYINRSHKPVVPVVKSNQPIYVQQEDDDALDGNGLDEPSAFQSTRKTLPNRQPYLYEVDYDNDFDGYFKSDLGSDLDEVKGPLTCSKGDAAEAPSSTGKTRKHSSQYDRVLRAATKESFTQPGEKRRRRGIVKTAADDKVHIDIALYTISGIILIFIMEQFVQIGLKIKHQV